MKNLLKKIAGKIQRTLRPVATVTALMIGCGLAMAQPSAGTGNTPQTYAPAFITLPYATLPSGGFGTNLMAGWTNTVYTTNSTIIYSQSAGGFVTNMIINTNNAIISPTIAIGRQRNLAIANTCSSSSGVGTNFLVFARSIDGTVNTLDLQNEFTLATLNPSATGPTVSSTNLPEAWIGGYGYVTLVSNVWLSASGVLTNGISTLVNTNGQQYGLSYGIKKL